jgi:hypothetical protein
MAELGVVVPVVGDFSDLADVGIGARLVATPDLL